VQSRSFHSPARCRRSTGICNARSTIPDALAMQGSPQRSAARGQALKSNGSLSEPACSAGQRLLGALAVRCADPMVARARVQTEVVFFLTRQGDKWAPEAGAIAAGRVERAELLTAR